MTLETTGDRSGAFLRRALARALPATPQERAAALWSFAYFFTLLAGYYVLRPLRDQMAITGGIRDLPWLFTATFATLLVAQPLYGMLVAKLPRARFIPIVNYFFVVNLALFSFFLTLQIDTALVARIFYVWVAVFSLFSVAVFWSFMADLFTADQGKRLFGFIGAGGTAGALLGPVLTIWLSVPLGPTDLLIPTMILIEAAVLFIGVSNVRRRPTKRRVRRRIASAAALLQRSPTYSFALFDWPCRVDFLRIVLRDHPLFRANPGIVAAEVQGAGAQTGLFAAIDLAVNLLTLVTQLASTGPLLQRFGTGVAAAVLPAVYAAGFFAVFSAPTLAAVLAAQVAQRSIRFALANPAGQVFLWCLAGRRNTKPRT